MKKEIADKWVADLRTNPPQANGVLFDGVGYCCLGRLCVVLGHEPVEKNGRFFVFYEHLKLPPEILREVGMVSNQGIFDRNEESLAEMNDDGKTFAEIADTIEQNWEKL